MGGDAELFHEMVELLKADAPRHLAVAWRSFREHDWPTLIRAAHTLKGLAANFGAGRVVTAATELERLAKSGQEDSAEAILGELSGAYDELAVTLSSAAAGQHASTHRV